MDHLLHEKLFYMQEWTIIAHLMQHYSQRVTVGCHSRLRKALGLSARMTSCTANLQVPASGGVRPRSRPMALECILDSRYAYSDSDTYRIYLSNCAISTVLGLMASPRTTNNTRRIRICNSWISITMHDRFFVLLLWCGSSQLYHMWSLRQSTIFLF